jgi:hypothetical protein
MKNQRAFVQMVHKRLLLQQLTVLSLSALMLMPSALQATVVGKIQTGVAVPGGATVDAKDLIVGPTAFAGHNKFYLGASSDTAVKDSAMPLENAVQSVQLVPNGDAWKVQFTGLTPNKVQVNSTPAADNKNPLTSAKIALMTTGYNGNPVVTIDPASDILADDTPPGDTRPKGKPWNLNDVAWGQANGVATSGKTAAAANAQKNAAATVFMIDQKTKNVLVTGNDKVGTAAVGIANNLNLLTTVDGTTNAAKIHAIAATPGAIIYNKAGNSAPFIFAAVSTNSDDFSTSATNDKQCGIAVIKVAETNLQPHQYNNFNVAGNKAVSLTPAITALSFGHGGAFAKDAAVDLHWDDKLQVLYAGVSHAQSANAANDGIFGVGMYKIAPTYADGNGGVNFFLPTLPLDIPATQQGIVAVKNKDATQSSVNVYKVRTMHTSTGKDYLITNGGVTAVGSEASVNTWLNALPLVPSTNKNYAGTLAEIAGTDYSFQPISKPANFPQLDQKKTFANLDVNEKKIAIGGHPHFLSADATAKIADLHVIGDTVYAALASDRTAGNLAVGGADDKAPAPAHSGEAGVFASTALFADKGYIRGWTPWQRVSGNTDVVTGFGYDENAQRLWCTTSADGKYAAPPVINTVKITQWGTGDATLHADADKTMHAVLKPLGTVNALVNFDDDTTGFKKSGAGEDSSTGNYQTMSMAVACGDQKLALIQTGGQALGAGLENTFEPVKDLAAKTFIFDVTKPASDQPDDHEKLKAADLAKLGRITTAELARNTFDNSGWLFVGGEKGLAVLSNQTAIVPDQGKGFSAGLDALDSADGQYPGDGKIYQFKQLTAPSTQAPDDAAPGAAVLPAANLTNIRKIVAQGKRGVVYVMTRDAVYHITPFEPAMYSGTITPAFIIPLFDLQTGVAGTHVDAVKNGLPVGVSSAAATDYATDKLAFTLQKGTDELYDMVLLQDYTNPDDVANETTTLLLATSQGLMVSNPFKDGFTQLADEDHPTDLFFKQVDPRIGAVFKLEIKNQMRGDGLSATQPNRYSLEANIYATALAADGRSLNVYRYNVSNGVVTTITEPYKDAQGNPVDYFYNIGSIDSVLQGNVTYNMPYDLVGRKSSYGSSSTDFVTAISAIPTSVQISNALTAGSEISADRLFTVQPSLDGVQIRDTASGAVYVPGQFGVLVNE